MIKRLLFFILILSLFVSCFEKKSAILVDSYFDELYNVSKEKVDGYDLIVLDPINVDYIDLNDYDSVITTSLLYKNKYQLFEEYNKKLLIVDFYGELKKNNHSAINASYIKLYEDLFVSLLKNVDKNNVAFIISEGMDIDTRDHNTLMVTKKTVKRDISTFVSNSDEEYWVVLNSSYIYYINEVLKDKKKILLNSEELFLFDENVLASIDNLLADTILKRSSMNAKIKKR